MTTTQPKSAEAWARELLPEWEIVQGPKHATPAFRFPVYASKCRDAVAAALQSLMDENAEAKQELARAGVTLPDVVDGRIDPPEHGWTCYHCGANFEGTFRGWQAAGHHFGWTPDAQPACRIAEEEGGLPRRLRSYEDGAKANEKALAAKDVQITALQSRIERDGKLMREVADELVKVGEYMRVRPLVDRLRAAADEPISAALSSQESKTDG